MSQDIHCPVMNEMHRCVGHYVKFVEEGSAERIGSR